MYGQTAAYDYAGNRIIWNYIPSDGSEVGIATVDKVTAAITKLTDSYYQLSSLASVYYVDPAPMPVEGLALSWKAGQLTASFSAPSTDQNGNALASLAKAELYRLNGNQLELEETLDNPVPGQVCTITHATSESGLQTYAVRVEDAEGNASAYVTAQATQIEITLPYANGFEADETEAMAALTISDPLGKGGMERTQEAAYEGEWSFKLTSDYNSDGRELILSGIPVEKGTTYEVSFAVASPGATNYDALYLVMDNDYSSAMSTGLSADWIPLMFNFTAAEDRQFTFSFLGLNGDLPIYLDNIGMREIAGPDVPGTLVVNSAMAADEGAMQVVLDMTAPDLSMGGEPLESLGGIIVEYSQSEYFEEFMADTIKSGIQLGEAADYTIDIEGGPGEYYVRARAYNEAGICPNYAYYEEEFWGTTIPLGTGFVGVDEVALPSTVYTAVNGDGTVTIGWRPASGANGGYVGDVSYGLEENGQSVAAADPAYDEASGRFQCTTTVLEPGLHTFVLTAGNGETEDSREIASLGGYEDYAWLHNVDPALTVEPNILFMETEEANSGFAQALYPAPGRPMYIDRLTLFATAPAEGTASERLKIYMGTTSMEYFTGGYLSEPDFVEKDSLTLVYDGEIQFKAGENAVEIPLTGYYYPGEGNIVLNFVKPMQEPAAFAAAAYTGETEYPMIKYRMPSTSIDFDTVSSYNSFTTVSAKYSSVSMMANENTDLGTINITVKDLETGSPLQDALVRICKAEGTEGLNLDLELRTDAEGRISFAYVPAGEFLIVARKAGYVSNEPLAVRVDGAGSTVTEEISLLEAFELQLSGTVSDVLGNPLSGVAVKAEGLAVFEDTTGEDGRYHLENIYGPSDYALSFAKEGMKTLSMNLDLGGKDSTLDVEMDYYPLPVSYASVSVNEEGAAHVEWLRPANTATVSWTPDGEGNQRMAIDQQSAFRYAQRFTPEDLEAYGLAEGSVLRIGFVPGSATAQYTLVICEDTTRELFRCPVSAKDVVEMEWYYADVTEDVSIDLEKELWLIVEVAESANQGYACAATRSGGVAGKGNLIEYAGVWYELTDLFGSASGNVLLALEVLDEATSVDPVAGYKIYRGLKDTAFDKYELLTQESVKELEYMDENYAALPFGQYVYAVVADWSGTEHDNLSSPVCTNVLNKDMEMDLAFEITSPAGSAQGASILLANDDDAYSAVADADGKAVIADVWRGAYELVVELPYHQRFVSDVSVSEDSTVKIALQEVITDPIILSASVNGKDATLTYGVNAYNWSDDIESYPDFAIDGLGEWILLGGGEKGGMQSSAQEAFVWPNMEEEQSFIVYNDNEAMPEPLGWPAYSGERCLLSMYRLDGEANNDYVVRPVRQGGGVFSFYVRGAQSSDEVYSVVYSVAGAGLEDFQTVDGYEGLMAPVGWSLVSVEIPEDAKYIGIRYESEYLFGLQLDDLSYQWDAPANPTGYELYVDGVLAGEVEAGELSYTFENLAGGEHDLGVVAVYASGKSGMVETTVEISDEAMPVDLAVSVEVTADGGNATLTWKAAEGFSPESYKVYLGEELKAENLTETTYVFEGLDNGEYTAAVVAVYATGESEKAMKDFEVKGVGNEFPASVADAVLYPNPSDGRFHISVPKACRMQLYSIAGRMIGQSVLTAGLQEFDLQALPAGTYYVRLVAGDEAVVLKAVIR